MRAIIVSGVSRGLGLAIFDCLIEHEKRPIGIGRKFMRRHLHLANDKQCTLVQCDLGVIDQIIDLDLSEKVPLNATQLVFVNNAATIAPIAQVGDFDEYEASKSVIVNILAPMLLINKIVKLSKSHDLSLKILNITSGAATKPLAGWSTYSTGKAATKFYLECLARERPQVAITNVDPGVLDTKMQSRIRLSSDTDFPERARFAKLHEDGKLRNPSAVAEEILCREQVI